VLKKAAETLKGSLQRAGDVAARHSGEDFTLLLPMAKEGQAVKTEPRKQRIGVSGEQQQMTIPG
jgi:PleD family two-component response regulator